MFRFVDANTNTDAYSNADSYTFADAYHSNANCHADTHTYANTNVFTDVDPDAFAYSPATADSDPHSNADGRTEHYHRPYRAEFRFR